MLKKYEGHDDRQGEFDFEKAENAFVNRELEKGIPAGAKLGGPFEKSRHFHKPLRSPEHEAHVRETTNRKRADTIRTKTKDKVQETVAPRSLREDVATLVGHMKDIEQEVHEGKKSLVSLYPDVRLVMEGIRAIGALLPQHEHLMNTPLETPNFLHRDVETTVGDELFGAFELYREILGNIESGAVKNGKEALEMHAQDMEAFVKDLQYIRDERIAIQEEGSGRHPTVVKRKK